MQGLPVAVKTSVFTQREQEAMVGSEQRWDMFSTGPLYSHCRETAWGRQEGGQKAQDLGDSTLVQVSSDVRIKQRVRRLGTQSVQRPALGFRLRS